MKFMYYLLAGTLTTIGKLDLPILKIRYDVANVLTFPTSDSMATVVLPSPFRRILEFMSVSAAASMFEKFKSRILYSGFSQTRRNWQ